MKKKFFKVSQTEQFLKIDANQLKRILNKYLNISTEYDVLKSVELWFNHDPENRKNHMVSLLKIIRLPLISAQVNTFHMILIKHAILKIIEYTVFEL